MSIQFVIFGYKITLIEVHIALPEYFYHPGPRRRMARRVRRACKKTDGYIPRIKEVRRITTWGLRESKKWVEAAFENSGRGNIK